MGRKKFIRLVFVLSFLSISVICIINFIIDPYGKNNFFNFQRINTSKFALDERVVKFNHLKQNITNIEAVIFGSSRTTILDPDIIYKATGKNAYNASFSSATVEEYSKYINWLIHSGSKLEYIFIGIDLFAFSDDFTSHGTMPQELMEDRYIDIKEYISFDMFKKALIVIYKNLYINTNDVEVNYLKKGMRYYNNYFERKNNEILKLKHLQNLENAECYWHASTYSKTKIQILKELGDICTKNGIKLYLFTNPLSPKQLPLNNYKNFMVLNELLSELVDLKLEIYDFNNFNSVNKNLEYFEDAFHYNYDVANFILYKLLHIENQETPSDFGILITKYNIKEYLKNLQEKINIF